MAEITEDDVEAVYDFDGEEFPWVREATEESVARMVGKTARLLGNPVMVRRAVLLSLSPKVVRLYMDRA